MARGKFFNMSFQRCVLSKINIWTSTQFITTCVAQSNWSSITTICHGVIWSSRHWGENNQTFCSSVRSGRHLLFICSDVPEDFCLCLTPRISTFQPQVNHTVQVLSELLLLLTRQQMSIHKYYFNLLFYVLTVTTLLKNTVWPATSCYTCTAGQAGGPSLAACNLFSSVLITWPNWSINVWGFLITL